LDVATKLPGPLWWDPDPTVNEKTFLDRVQAVLTPGVLVLLDRGFSAFPPFDWLTQHAVTFITRRRGGHSVWSVEQLGYATARARAAGHHSGRISDPLTGR